METILEMLEEYKKGNRQVTVENGVKKDCFALGLTKINNYLYMLAEDHKGYGGSTTILKLNTSGVVIDTFSIKSLFTDGALGITAADGTTESFIIMAYAQGSSASTLTFKKVVWGKTTADATFKVKNQGYGYTAQLQDIYYHTTYGLFILTNNTFSTLQNRILVVEPGVTSGTYTPKTVINVNLKKTVYSQYNLESICMKANHIVLAANIIKADGTAEDRFSVLNGITYANGTFTFKCELTDGTLVPITIDGIKVTNLGCMTFYNGVPYFVKQYKNINAVFGNCPQYANPSGTVSKVEDYSGGELGHANGMTCYMNNGVVTFFVATAEKDEKKNRIVALNSNGQILKTYTVSSNTGEAVDIKAINYYTGNQSLLLSTAGGNLKLYTCSFGSDTSVKATCIGTIKNTGYSTTQDIFYHATYGLFVVTCHLINEQQTTKNTLLHYDLRKLDSRSISDTSKALVPDFGFITDMPTGLLGGDPYYTFELESVAINNGQMAAVYNVYTEKKDGTHPEHDRFKIFSNMTFN